MNTTDALKQKHAALVAAQHLLNTLTNTSEKTFLAVCTQISDAIALKIPEEKELASEVAHVRQNLVSVQPLWCLALPVQQQSVLLLGARGPDGIAKAHPCKRIQRAYRACVLVAARYGRSLAWAEKADTFMCLQEFSDELQWLNALTEFFKHADDLPHHFYMHLVHGAEILGYKHPDERFRAKWRDFYGRCVKEFHLIPETEIEMDARLSDWQREHWEAPSVSTAPESDSASVNPKSAFLKPALDALREILKVVPNTYTHYSVQSRKIAERALAHYEQSKTAPSLSKETQLTPFGELWTFFAEEHDLRLTETELHDVIENVKRYCRPVESKTVPHGTEL